MDSGFPSRSTRQARARLELSQGFTLIELMVVLLIIAILAGIAIPSYIGSLRAARESNLKQDLHVMRDGIMSYTTDKAKAPKSLEDLVTAGYLKSIPVDPMTHSDTTWVTTTDDSYYSLDQTDTGVVDVHSGSEETNSDGKAYSSW